ncbi:MAG: NAD-glutamate dehydrogenase [Rhodospirillales bacterium]|nr:NAD-glutamate dehydrogenase [Rhodospirillales bacterium]
MNAIEDKARNQILRKAAAQARRMAGKRGAKLADKFLGQFYGNVSATDLAERGAARLAGDAMAMLKLSALRKPGQVKIEVRDPGDGSDEVSSAHTVIDVLSDDVPFLVDSASAEISRLGHTVHLIIHPVIRTRRDKTGKLTDIVARKATGDGVRNESMMSVTINRQGDPARIKEIEKCLKSVLRDVHAAVADWQSICEKVREIINDLKVRFAEGAGAGIVEAQDFLQWALDNHFTFLGYREYDFIGQGRVAKVHIDPKSGMGVLRNPRRLVFNELRHLGRMPGEVQRFVRRPDPLIISKADIKSTVHRPVLMDTIGVKKFDANGKVIGERLIAGLFTSVAYSSSPRDIPLLRRKLDRTIARAGYAPDSHDGKALQHILETFPRDELFQSRDEDLMETSLGVLQLQERRRVALFARMDDFARFVSCLIYVPRDSYTTTLRHRLQAIVEEAYGGEVSGYAIEFTETPLARLHLVIALNGGKKPNVDIQALEASLARAAQSWPESLRDALTQSLGASHGLRLSETYGQAFPANYTEKFIAEEAVSDIELLESVLANDCLMLDLYRPAGAKRNTLRFKVFHPRTRLPLSDVLPMLEDMGLKVIDEIPYEVRPQGEAAPTIMIHDFGLITRDGGNVSLDAIRENFHEVFRRTWEGEMESDGFNALVLNAGLGCRDIVVLRGYAKYLRQTNAPFSQKYMERALGNNPQVAAATLRLFHARFDPQNTARGRQARRLTQSIRALLDKVESADEDRILRRFWNGIEATLRTNFFQTDADGNPKSYLSIKLDSGAVDELPLPRPMREIFVYSPRFEAIHLRGGLVARGGLRWSDRPEDFRTEILGLMKAQMVKNAVIVPVGSKGGFVVKRPPTAGGRDAFIAEGIACYKKFMSGLLDITDNYKGSRIVAPKDVVCHDDDDPYLVVAADKGTATFSDIANGVSDDYGFWLGDAYASGGSVGYDHKKMGITARGAWESVKRHFREIGKDIQKEDFTVIGVGDMSGDVFGNGMLLSKHIKLLGAFNHLHIFIDPDPDPANSFAERKRLFNLPRSSWSDYNAKLISKGGGIFERRAKSINLTPQIKSRFGIIKSQVTPGELIRILLLAEVELLWFGGIGTYIKASSEAHADAGDRANDAIRVDGRELRCQVIGEGANLGATQHGRIEYALAGGSLNTDSVDNSAGVDCSDHEVNIKILLDSAVAKKKLTGPGRNKVLERMTDEVGELVLRDNYLQTQAITMTRSRDTDVLDRQVRFLRMLERAGRLDRAVEFLPDDETLEERERDKIGLTRPEIAVVMPYAKLWLYDEILASDLPDERILQTDLIEYFPTLLRQKYKNEILGHRLAREIIATVVTNSMINRVGGTFVTNLMEKSGARPVDIARAYIVVRDTFDLRSIWHDIEALDNKIAASMQVTLLEGVNQLIERATLWLLRGLVHPIKIGDAIKEFKPGIEQLKKIIKDAAPDEVIDRVEYRVQRYVSEGVPTDLARRVAYLLLLISSFDIVRTESACRIGIADVARLYFRVGEAFGLGWLRYGAEQLPADNHWQKLASAAMIEELYTHQIGITLRIITAAGGKADNLDAWISSNAQVMEQTRQMMNELEAAEQVDLSMLAVASRHLSAMAG